VREVEFVKDNFLNIFLDFFLPRFFSFLCTVSFIKTGAVDTLVGGRGVRAIVKSFPTADAGGGVPTVDDDCVRLVPIVVRPKAADDSNQSPHKKNVGPLGEAPSAKRLKSENDHAVDTKKRHVFSALSVPSHLAESVCYHGQVRVARFPNPTHLRFISNAGDCSDRRPVTVCPYIVQYTPNTGLTLSFISRPARRHAREVRRGEGRFARRPARRGEGAVSSGT
jgi:hypothetical protein